MDWSAKVWEIWETPSDGKFVRIPCNRNLTVREIVVPLSAPVMLREPFAPSNSKWKLSLPVNLGLTESQWKNTSQSANKLVSAYPGDAAFVYLVSFILFVFEAANHNCKVKIFQRARFSAQWKLLILHLELAVIKHGDRSTWQLSKMLT